MQYCWIDETPVGRILVAGTDEGLHHISFQDAHFSSEAVQIEEGWSEDLHALRDATRQLREYFAGKRKQFDLKLAPKGTEFQQNVWHALCDVPYGKTASYGDIAAAVGNPNASRAVGLANGQNPIAIVIPCHRIIGKSGRLTGYGGGLDRKQTLLDLESGGRPLIVSPR